MPKIWTKWTKCQNLVLPKFSEWNDKGYCVAVELLKFYPVWNISRYLTWLDLFLLLLILCSVNPWHEVVQTSVLIPQACTTPTQWRAAHWFGMSDVVTIYLPCVTINLAFVTIYALCDNISAPCDNISNLCDNISTLTRITRASAVLNHQRKCLDSTSFLIYFSLVTSIG